MIKHLRCAIVFVLLGAGGRMLIAAPAGAQSAGQDMKDAGRSTAHATKKTAHEVKRGVKKGVHKSAHEVDKGARKVEGKTQTPPQP